MKKNKASKKSGKTRRTNRGWGQVYKFKKLPKIEPTRESIYGCVLAALRKLKRGTVEQVAEEAGRQGLHKVTGQNPYVQTQIKLRLLVSLGSAEVTRMTPEELAKPAGAKRGPKPGPRIVIGKRTGTEG
jgi:hypothetical protein